MVSVVPHGARLHTGKMRAITVPAAGGLEVAVGCLNLSFSFFPSMIPACEVEFAHRVLSQMPL